jgi:predicted metal-dependent enzyme (double-stranded beta helix superfamily)
MSRLAPETAAPIARAVESALTGDPVAGVGRALELLEAAGWLDDEALFAAPSERAYTRKLIWLDPRERFVVVGMTWSPGQSTPLHDHAGFWVADIVTSGTMFETLYRVTERAAGGRVRFERELHRIAKAKDIGGVRPPLEHHEFGNAGEGVARTVHVYGGNMVRANAYERGADGLWSALDTALTYDD